MLNSLQILRALAAWAVVFNHIQQSFYMGKSDSVFWEFFGVHGGFGVDVFFILSGFMMALVSKKYQESGISFGINRIYRLVPIYWFYTLLLVLSILALPTGTFLTWWEDFSLLKSLLFIPNLNPNGYGHFPTLYVGWTLIYEMFFYMVFSIILILKLPKPAITCSLLLVIMAYYFRWNPFLGHSSLLLVEFSIGIIIFEYYKRTKVSGFLIRVIIPLFSFILLASLFLYIDRVQFSKFFLAGLVVYVFILLEDIFTKDFKLFKFLKVLGDHSYSTYLNHTIIIG
jgi:peptidoglycan/LPS O-acetylase OafA/YrhL